MTELSRPDVAMSHFTPRAWETGRGRWGWRCANGGLASKGDSSLEFFFSIFRSSSLMLPSVRASKYYCITFRSSQTRKGFPYTFHPRPFVAAGFYVFERNFSFGEKKYANVGTMHIVRASFNTPPHGLRTHNAEKNVSGVYTGESIHVVKHAGAGACASVFVFVRMI